MYSLKASKVPLAYDGIIAIFMGVTAIIFSPTCFALGAGIMFAGAGAIVYDYMTKSKFDTLWKNLDLCIDEAIPMLKQQEDTGSSIIYKFSMPKGLCSEDFIKHQLAIEEFLGSPVKIKYVYKELWIEVYKEKLIEAKEYQSVNLIGKVPVLIGYDRNGQQIFVDLSNGQPHMLIAGETGSGKSTTLRSIITNLLLTTNVKIYLIDLKMGAEFNIFKNCKNVERFSRTRSEALGVLQEVSTEVDKRYDMFFKNDCVDITEYNKKFSKKLDYKVVIIDEFADLMDEKDTVKILEELSAKARACGIHLIISTQRPDHKVLSGRIKANVAVVLGLKTTNSTNSQIIIDDLGLEKLNGKGHGILKNGYTVEIQSPYLSSEKAKELLKPVEEQGKSVKMFASVENGKLTGFEFLDEQNSFKKGGRKRANNKRQ